MLMTARITRINRIDRITGIKLIPISEKKYLNFLFFYLSPKITKLPLLLPLLEEEELFLNV